MKRIILGLLFVNLSLSANANPLPSWFMSAFKGMQLDRKYELNSHLSPNYMEADFNGDDVKDAALVIERKSRKGEIFVIHGKSNQHFVFGAGVNFGNGSDDFFNWLKNGMCIREILFMRQPLIKRITRATASVPLVVFKLMVNYIQSLQISFQLNSSLK